MQTRLTQYILRQLVGTTLFVAFILLAILSLVKVLQVLDLMLKAQASTKVFLKFMLLILPDLLILVLPIACFIAVLFVYSRLMMDREVIASYAAGYSVAGIAKPALGWGGFLSVLILFLNLWVLPNAFHQFRTLESELKNAAPAIFIQEGVFNTFGDVMLYVHEKKSARGLRGIIAYVQRPNEGTFTITAEDGEMIYHDQVPNLLLYNGNRQEFDESTQKLSILLFDQTSVPLKPSKSIHAPRGRKIYEMDTYELLNSAQGNDESQSKRVYAEFSQRILVPWYALTFSCIGIIFLLLKPFTRTFQLSAVVSSVFTVVVLESLTLMLLNLGARFWMALVGAYLLQTITIAGCFYLLLGKKS